MTDSTRTSAQSLVAARPRRVVQSPGGRPDLRLVTAHACRPVAAGRVAHPASCRVVSPAKEPVSPWLRVKVAVVGALVLTGWVVPLTSFVTSLQVDPKLDYVAGDPAWAHVTAP